MMVVVVVTVDLLVDAHGVVDRPLRHITVPVPAVQANVPPASHAPVTAEPVLLQAAGALPEAPGATQRLAHDRWRGRRWEGLVGGAREARSVNGEAVPVTPKFGKRDRRKDPLWLASQKQNENRNYPNCHYPAKRRASSIIYL